MASFSDFVIIEPKAGASCRMLLTRRTTPSSAIRYVRVLIMLTPHFLTTSKASKGKQVITLPLDRS